MVAEQSLEVSFPGLYVVVVKKMASVSDYYEYIGGKLVWGSHSKSISQGCSNCLGGKVVCSVVFGRSL